MYTCSRDFPGGASGKKPAWQHKRHKRCGFDPRVGKMPWRRKWQPTPAFMPGESHGQRSLEGYRPQGSKGSYTTEVTKYKHLHTEVHGASQVAQWQRICLAMQEMQVRPVGWEDALEEEIANHSNIFCLENPRDRGYWQATVHEVTKSQMQLSDWAGMHTCSHQNIFCGNAFCECVSGPFFRNSVWELYENHEVQAFMVIQQPYCYRSF